MHIKTKGNKIAVFLGPSLEHRRASKILDATYFPPIQRGDLKSALAEGFQTIGIIDGNFHCSFTISPFEILDAIKAELKIFGAASMGALKAVECSPFGMTGIGKIYQWYRSGKLEAEDEVAVTYHPETFKALSDPLVNMRHTFELALEAGIIDIAQKRRLTHLAKKNYFPERSYRALFEKATRSGFSNKVISKLEFFAKREECDLKSLDAIACLKAIKDYIELIRS